MIMQTGPSCSRDEIEIYVATMFFMVGRETNHIL